MIQKEEEEETLMNRWNTKKKRKMSHGKEEKGENSEE